MYWKIEFDNSKYKLSNYIMFGIFYTFACIGAYLGFSAYISIFTLNTYEESEFLYSMTLEDLVDSSKIMAAFVIIGGLVGYTFPTCLVFTILYLKYRSKEKLQ